MIPQRYTITTPIISSYDYFDLTAGLGYRTYYGCGGTLSGANVKWLTPRQTDASTMQAAAPTVYGIYTAGVVISAAGATFDIEFNLPATLAAANAFVAFTVYQPAGEAPAPKVYIYHYDGSTETLLGSTQGVERTGAGATYYRESMKVNLSEKHFGRGDILRLKIEIENYGARAAQLKLYHDPTSGLTFADLDGRTIGSDLTLDIPVKVKM